MSFENLNNGAKLSLKVFLLSS